MVGADSRHKIKNERTRKPTMPLTHCLQTRSQAIGTKVATHILPWMFTLFIALLPHHAVHASSDKAAGNKHSETTQAKKTTKVKQARSPSEESKAERDRRLYRECRGRPNAGACLGYTQKP